MRRVLMLVCGCLLAMDGIVHAQGFVVGPTFGISAIAPLKRFPDVAYGGGVYFVVYGNGIVQGQFISDSGAVLASVGSVSNVPGVQQTPRVVYNPDNNTFLVTWLDYRVGNFSRPYGRIVSYNGGAPAFVTDEFMISPTSGGVHSERAAAVAYSTVSKNFLVVWHQFGPPSNDIHARLVSPTGALLLNEIALTNDNAFQGEVDVTYNPVRDEYYTTYNYSPSDNVDRIMAQRIQASTGALLDPAPGRELTAGAYRAAPAVAYNPFTGLYLAGWYQIAAGQGMYGRLVNGDGTAASAVIPLSTRYFAYDAFGLALNRRTGTFFGVTHSTINEDAAFEVDGAGTPGPAFIATSTGNVRGNFNPRVAASENVSEWLMVTANNFAQIMGQRLGSSAVAPGGPTNPTPPGPTACTVTLDPASTTVTSAAGSGTIGIAGTPAGCTWKAGSNASWITVGAATGTGASLTYSWGVNSAAANRGGTITISGQTFTVKQHGQSAPRMSMDLPHNNTVVSQPFVVGGWAVDLASASGPGMDTVHVYAYPNPGSGQAPVFLGVASFGGPRGDLGAYFGSQFTNCGWGLVARGLAAGPYQIVAFAHSTVAGGFNIALVANVTVGQSAAMYTDIPAAGAVPSSFRVAGWALDQAAPTGTGVDAVHVYAYPLSGGPPILLGVATLGDARPDVGAYFGSQFDTAGFSLNVSGVASGSYNMVVFARSTVAKTFNNVQVIPITVP